MAVVKTREPRQTFRGLSISAANPMGRRSGHRAPRSLRRRGFNRIEECKDEDIAKYVFGLDLQGERNAIDKKRMATLRGQITKLEKQVVKDPKDDQLEKNREIQIRINALQHDIDSMEVPVKKIEALVKDFRSAV